MFCDLRPFFAAHPVLLAPMAGVTDEAFRALCAEQGASLCYTEMVSSKALSFANEKTRHLLSLAPGEDLVAVQLFGHEPETMAQQAAWVEETLGAHVAYLDINMGCPARKIVSKGDGSALMKTPELACEIIQAVNEAARGPVTVKFRRGWAVGEETAVEFARMAQRAGASAVTVHGRYAQQFYHGQADWGVIARVRQAVDIPVVGNGDVRTGEDAVRMRAETGCDAVMVGRGAEGNPWAFAQVRAALAGEEPPAAPSPYERVAMARRHARLLARRDERSVVRMRKHAMWYTHGMPRAAEVRAKFTQCSTVAEFDAVFDEVLEHVAEYERWQRDHGYDVPWDTEGRG